MAAGQRAGIAIQAVKQGWSKAAPSVADCPISHPPEVSDGLRLLRQNDLPALEHFLASHLSVHGAAAFARELAIPLFEAVGSLWQQGRLPVYAEHAFSGVLQKVAQQPLARPVKSALSTPLILLASPAGESHTMALVLLNAVVHEAGIPTVLLQGGLPAKEIADAALAFRARVVALSASSSCPSRLLTAELRSLRALLDSRTELWFGGSGTQRISTRLDGITVMQSLDDALDAIKTRIWTRLNNEQTEKDQGHD